MENKKKSTIKKITKYFYLSLFLINLVAIFYSYLFIKKNVYFSINFDESNFPQNLRELGDINMSKFNEVINKIDEKKISKTPKINDFFND